MVGGLSFFSPLSFEDDASAGPGLLWAASKRISESAFHTFPGRKISKSRTGEIDKGALVAAAMTMPLLYYIAASVPTHANHALLQSLNISSSHSFTFTRAY